MKCYLNLLPLIIVFLSSTTSGQTRTELIDSLMRTSYEKGIFNGNVLVLEADQVVYRNELGRADSNETKELTTDTRFNLGSISKEFSAVGIMLLKEQGKLSLEDRISDYISQLPEWSHEIQIKNLLDYTSGLPKEEDEISGDEAAWAVLRNLSTLEATPGTKFIYSNFNIFLRKRIIENITGMEYGQFLKTNFFEPLQMRSAVIDGIPGTSKIACAFDNHFIEDTYKPFLSGQVSLDIDDLQKWVDNLHSGKIISKNSLYRLFQRFGNNETGLGLGIFEEGKLMLHWHSGSSYNFQSSLCYFPQDKFMILLMTNNKNMNLGDLTTAIEAILRGREFELPKKSLYLSLRTEAFYSGYEKALELYKDIKEDRNYDLSNKEKAFLRSAEYLLRQKKYDDAVGILEYTLKEFPGSEEATAALKEAKKFRKNQ